MNEFDIPIFQKSYDLYKTLHGYRCLVPKQDRYTIFERADNAMLSILSGIFKASTQKGREKHTTLSNISTNINMLRIFIRLMKDVQAIDNKKYLSLQTAIDEIGRMLGGWIRSIENK